jgi:3-oxoacyl-[acyl-carrier protein] reductase
MSDRYAEITRLPIAGQLVKNLGLPQPVELDRYDTGDPVIDGPVLVGAAPGGRLGPAIASLLGSIGAEVHSPEGDIRDALAQAEVDAKLFAGQEDQRFKALVFDATGIKRSDQLIGLKRFFSPTIRQVLPSGRVIVLGTPPENAADPREATVQRALEGFTRSVGKEVKRGSTSQLVYVAPGAEKQIESTLRFFLSPKSAYVSAQVVRIGKAAAGQSKVDWTLPLAGKTAVVTGASRGIGKAIAETLARDGADVITVDMPGTGADVELDITSAEAPEGFVALAGDGIDILVHNAGITRDKTLGRMSDELWDQVIDVNLGSEERINDALLASEKIRPGGRIVCVSSLSGIAGNAGQTNYATSKAGVAGMVQFTAPELAKKKITINAVAPGFIETQMTAAMPFAIREAGRRMNSMSQGGLPVDVAETIAWFAQPASGGITGNVIRVCGQSLLGA